MSWTRVFRRAGRRTNAALLTLLVGAFLTGWLAFAAARPVPAALATLAHGLFGVGAVSLVPWKSVIVGRARSIPAAGWALMVLVVACLAAGFVQLLGGFGSVAGLSPIQVHVGSALVGVPLLVWHVVRRRSQRLRPTDLSRRALLRTGVFTLGVGTAYAASLGLAGVTRGSAGRAATGSGRLAPDELPATIWLLDRVPELDPGTHRVDVAGRLLSAPDLRTVSRPVSARLDCTSGWYVEATWTGSPLSELIPADQLVQATSVEVTSVTGYTRRFPVGEAANLWLATAFDGQPLTAGTGAPVRLVAPNHRGFWWVKWVASVRLSDQPAWLQLPFPPQ